MITSDSPITALPGVGEARAKAFKKLGVENIRGLLCHYPRAYQYRGHVRSVAEARSVEGPVSLVLQVVSVPEEHRAYGRGKSYLRFRASDGTGTVSVTFFNQPFLKDTFRPERRFRFWGKLDTSHGVSMTSPVYEPCVDSTGAELAPIVPVYPLSAGLSQKFISERVRTALGAVITESDILPASVLLENGLCTYSFAMRNIHFPENTDALERARRRLMFEQLFVLSASLCMKKAQRTVSGARALESSDLSPFTDLLPYEMTDAQKRSVGEIASDLARRVPMKRILCGDVGSGKTVCAFAAAYIAVKSGAQAALMAPTEILAKQHYAEAKPLFEKLGFTVSLLCGSMTKAQKDKTRRMLEGADGERIDFIIGTHALLTDSVKFDDLGLVITDEQHRFGVMQRAALEEKAENVHTLVMSATPIPRTLSLIKYGDLDISRIDEMPRGRKKIGTFCVDSSYRDRLNAFIEKQAAKGHQTYVVCPAIEEQAKKAESAEEMADIYLTERINEGLPVKSATECAAELSAKLDGLRVACIHGKMKAAEKDAVMASFSAGETDVLVATTVIEVGVNVPSATLMVVENAERFGLSQLHQLRGRVGRGSAKSWCILMSDTKNEKSRERLAVMEKSSNGFDIAEEDLRLRGPGDFLGRDGEIRQSGEADLGLADGCTDPELIARASQSAAALVGADPSLSAPEHALLRAECEKKLSGYSKTVN